MTQHYAIIDSYGNQVALLSAKTVLPLPGDCTPSDLMTLEGVLRRERPMHTKLEEERRAQGLKQAELAEKAGVSQALVSAIETGVREPSFNSAEKLAQALSLPRAVVFPLDQYPQLRQHHEKGAPV
jgi:DNA-binding XRE family transcriptional regulator